MMVLRCRILAVTEQKHMLNGKCFVSARTCANELNGSWICFTCKVAIPAHVHRFAYTIHELMRYYYWVRITRITQY